MNRRLLSLCLVPITLLAYVGCSSESGPGVAPAPAAGAPGAADSTATPGKIAPNIAKPTTKAVAD